LTTHSEIELTALGSISGPNCVNQEAEISVAFMPSTKSAKLWKWNYLVLFIDCIELVPTWIYIFPSYDQSGQFLIARATEGHIFILDARPSKLFEVLGYVGNICNNINYIVSSLFAVF